MPQPNVPRIEAFSVKNYQVWHDIKPKRSAPVQSLSAGDDRCGASHAGQRDVRPSRGPKAGGARGGAVRTSADDVPIERGVGGNRG
jgi:hypothetical protein